MAPTFEDGCWLVDLAPVADGADVAMAVAASVGAPVTDGASLVDYLADRHMLVLLDNCEHVIGDVADLVESVLGRADEVHVLATSREPLGLDGEVVRRVGSLAVPNNGASVEEASSIGSSTPICRAGECRVGGFRARRVERGARGRHLPTTRRHSLGHRAGGGPNPLDAARGPLPTTGRALPATRRWLPPSAGASPHLFATVSWSHDLLSVPEQVVFRRLAIFPASFTLEAAEQVAGRDDDAMNATECLLNLVDRSLVQFDPAEGRYRLLETLRQFAADRLGESGETELQRKLHARMYLDLVETHAPGLTGRDYLNTLAILTLELENLRATAAWCI